MIQRLKDWCEDAAIFFWQEVVIGMAEAIGAVFWLFAIVFWGLHLFWIAALGLTRPDYDFPTRKSPLPPPPSAN